MAKYSTAPLALAAATTASAFVPASQSAAFTYRSNSVVLSESAVAEPPLAPLTI